MRFASIVGARPQFVKLAAVSRALRTRNEEVIIHTGQHYDHCLSDAFFRELSIPTADYHLGIGSGHHGAQTGRMLEAIETVLERHGLALVTQRPDGSRHLIGMIDSDQRRIWETMRDLGSGDVPGVASAAGLPHDRVQRALDDLWRRRLVIREEKAYVSLAGLRPTP